MTQSVSTLPREIGARRRAATARLRGLGLLREISFPADIKVARETLLSATREDRPGLSHKQPAELDEAKYLLKWVDKYTEQVERDAVAVAGKDPQVRMASYRVRYTETKNCGRLYARSLGDVTLNARKPGGRMRTLGLQGCPRALRPAICGRECHDIGTPTTHSLHDHTARTCIMR